MLVNLQYVANISYFSEWLDKISVNGIFFLKFTKAFPYQNLALYGLILSTLL